MTGSAGLRLAAEGIGDIYPSLHFFGRAVARHDRPLQFNICSEIVRCRVRAVVHLQPRKD
jgi:hypothetical protein